MSAFRNCVTSNNFVRKQLKKTLNMICTKTVSQTHESPEISKKKKLNNYVDVLLNMF